MKKLKLKALELGAKEVLTRAQLKNVWGGSGGSGGSGSSSESHTCTWTWSGPYAGQPYCATGTSTTTCTDTSANCQKGCDNNCDDNPCCSDVNCT